MAGQHDEVERRRRRQQGLTVLVLVIGLAVGMIGRYFFDRLAVGNPGDNQSMSTTGQEEETTPKPPVLSLSADRMMSRFITAVAGLEPTESVYNSIPAQQMGGLTYEQFQRYVNMYGDILLVTPTSFVPMSTSERDRQINSIIENDPELAGVAESSTYYWLEAESLSMDGAGLRFPFALQVREDGLIYYSADWVLSSLDIFSYTQTYLQAIDANDAVILAGLLSSRSNDAAVRQAKADYTLTFYEALLPPLNRHAEVLSLRMDAINFVVEMPAADGSTWEHPIEIQRGNDGVIAIEDQIPMNVQAGDIFSAGLENLALPGERVRLDELGIGDRTLYWAIDPTAGLIVSEAAQQVLLHVEDDQALLGAARSDQIIISVDPEIPDTLLLRSGQWLLVRMDHYEYILADVSAAEDDPESLEGTLLVVRSSDSSLELNGQLDTRMTYNDWLLQFPMLDQFNWELTLSDQPLTLGLPEPALGADLSEARPLLLQLVGPSTDEQPGFDVAFAISDVEYRSAMNEFVPQPEIPDEPARLPQKPRSLLDGRQVQ